MPAFSVDLAVYHTEHTQALLALAVGGAAFSPFEARYPAYENVAFEHQLAVDAELSKDGTDAMEQRYIVNQKSLNNCTYVTNCFLEIHAPALMAETSRVVFYTWALGYAMWDSCTVEIGGELVETIQSYFADMHQELHSPPAAFAKEAVFKHSPVHLYDLERLSTASGGVSMMVPIPFFFTRKGAYLPMDVTKEAVVSVYFREIDAFCASLPINSTETAARPCKALSTGRDLEWSLFDFRLWVTTVTTESRTGAAVPMLVTTAMAHSQNEEGESFRQSGELLIDLRAFSRPTKNLVWAVADDRRVQRDLVSGTAANPYAGEDSVRLLNGDRVQHVVPDMALPSGNFYSGHQSLNGQIVKTAWHTLRKGSKVIHRVPPETPFILNMRHTWNTTHPTTGYTQNELGNFFLQHAASHPTYVYESELDAGSDDVLGRGLDPATTRRLNFIVNAKIYVDGQLLGETRLDDPLLDSQRQANKTGLLCSFLVEPVFDRNDPNIIENFDRVDFVSQSRTFDDMIMNSVASILTKGTRNLTGFRTMSWRLFDAASNPDTTTDTGPFYSIGTPDQPAFPTGLNSVYDYRTPTTLGMSLADEAALVPLGFVDSFSYEKATPTSTTETQVTLSGDWSISGGATNEFPTGGEGNLVDGNTAGTDYVMYGSQPPSTQAPFILTYDHGSQVQVNKYKLFRHTSLYPTKWFVEASNDNIEWTVIDSTYQYSALGAVTSDVPDIATFNEANVSYRYFRINFISTVDSTANYEIKVREIQFFTIASQVVTIGRYDLSGSSPALKTAATGGGAYYTNTDGDLKGLFVPVNASVKLFLGDTDIELPFASVASGTRLVKDAFDQNSVPIYSWVSGSPTGQLMTAVLDTMRQVPGSLMTSLTKNGLQPQIRTHTDVEMFNENGTGVYLPTNRFDFRAVRDSQEVASMELVDLKIAGSHRWSPDLPAASYFNKVTTQAFNRVPREGIHAWTFAMSPSEDGKATGLAALGKMTNKKLRVKTQTKKASLLLYSESFGVFDGRRIT